jgi:glycosyltransferase involved in cell wall biosynthesis
MKQKHKPHVVYFITKLELGGAQKVCLELFNSLPSHGFETTLISGISGELVPPTYTSNTILLPALQREVSLRSFFQEIKAFFNLFFLFRRLKKEHPNLIVHTHSTKAGVLGRWAAFCAGIKKRVHTIHGYGFHDHQSSLRWYAIYWIELLTSFITTHFICVSQADVKTGVRLLPGFAKKYSLIRAAINWKPFIQQSSSSPALHASSPRRFVFGTTSCFKPQKNLFDLLHAFKTVHQHFSYARLEMIGDGYLRPHITEWLQDNNLTEVVTLHGWQPDIAPIMQQWHAFVLSSLWEGLPCAIIEARLLKLPVISYKTGGIPEVIHDGVNGLLCEQKNWLALAAQMVRLISDKTLYATLQSHADNLDDFQATYMVAQHHELYRQLGNQKLL